MIAQVQKVISIKTQVILINIYKLLKEIVSYILMVNYGKTKVYKIWSPKGDKIYIGSTTKDYLCKRMDQHRHGYKKKLCNNSNKCTTSFLIFEEYGIDNCFIELIEAKECISKDEQIKLEGGYIRNLTCVNKIIPDRTDKEYKATHKEQLSIWQKQKNNCICGSIYTKCNKSQHEKTTKHINFIQQTQ
jgi:hypothetical protein